eukprot:scaffold12242_cov55-Phaeocystis_antarctica.AAC.1
MQGIGAAASGEKRGRQDDSRDDEDGDVRMTAETMNEGDRGGNDGDDAPRRLRRRNAARREAARSAPGARLAVAVGSGQSQTVAVGAAQRQPVAVPAYNKAFLRLCSTYFVLLLV